MHLLSWILVASMALAQGGGAPGRGRIVAPGLSVMDAPSAAPSPLPSAGLKEYEATAPAGAPRVKLVQTPSGIIPVIIEPSPSPSPGAPGQEEALVQEAAREGAGFRKAYEAINGTNPISDSFGAANGDPNSAQARQLQQFQRFLSNPWVKKLQGALSDPALLEAINHLVEHPNKRFLLYVELGLIALLFVFRTWRKASVESWRARLWVDFYSFVIFLGLSAGAAPYFLLGQPYVQVVQALLGASGLPTIQVDKNSGR